MTPIPITDSEFPLGVPSSIPLGVDSAVTSNKPPNDSQASISFDQRKRQITMMLTDW